MAARRLLTDSDLAMDGDAIRRSFVQHVEYTLAKDEYSATPRDLYASLAYSVRDRLCDRWNRTQQRYHREDVRRVYYLSLEYLVGPLLDSALINLGIDHEARAALRDLDIDVDEIARQEDDPGLGNGGLGRLAACFLDSMATLGLPAMGYGIRYEYGIFRQAIVGGEQEEHPDTWLRYPNPWIIPRPESLFRVRFGGRVETRRDGDRDVRVWLSTDDVLAMAHDIPVPGYQNDVVNTLRLWGAKATRELDVAKFSQGDYVEAMCEKTATENLARVLYPNDKVAFGRELRLKQEYFFVSATLQDAIRRHLAENETVATLGDKAVFQLNDTHPAVAVVELMRLLVDERGLGWDAAWAVTGQCFAYTNHTVMPEALEEWPVALFERLLPRPLEIVYEVNRRFLRDVRARFPGDEARVQRVSIIYEGGERRIRMAHLAIVGSFSVNGVSALHSRILRQRLFPDFAEMFPGRFGNQTNGITPRRWLRQCNPWLSDLVSSRIGDGWVRDLDQLRGIARHADDPEFRAAWRAAKRAAKQRLVDFVQKQKTMELRLDAGALFDVHVKRIHEYKRQTLALLHAVMVHRRLRSGVETRTPRVLLFAGKAAPGYAMAKRIIRLINDVAATINADPATSDRLKILFLPNYGVSLAQIIIPAADLSEQISTAGSEASGTGNMKLALNGALTIGTLDGANVEIREAVGPENLFAFGLTEEEVEARRRSGYRPRDCVDADPELAATLAALSAGEFSPSGPEAAREVVSALIERDPYLVLADFAAYRDCQRRVEAAFADQEAWTRMSIANVAQMGRFSSDATIAGYAREIWRTL